MLDLLVRRIGVKIGITSLLSILLPFSACQPAGNPNANSNANAANTNSNASANTNAGTETGPTINTREPEKYSATLVFTIETQGGDKTIGIPPLSVQVA